MCPKQTDEIHHGNAREPQPIFLLPSAMEEDDTSTPAPNSTLLSKSSSSKAGPSDSIPESQTVKINGLTSDDSEVPTAPPTPNLGPSPRNSPAPPNTPSTSPFASDYHIKAHEPKCGICHLNVKFMEPQMRINHINLCWIELRMKYESAKIAMRGHALHLQPQDVKNSPISTTNSNRNTHNPRKSRNARLPVSQANVQGHLIPVLAEVIPLASCPICLISLQKQDAINALHHLVLCLDNFNPRACRTCSTPLPLPFAPTAPPNQIMEIKQDIIYHIYACHHAANEIQVSDDEYASLIAAWSGRCEVVNRNLLKTIGERKNWSAKDHRKSYMEKREVGYEEGTGVYWVGESSMRSAWEKGEC